MMLSTHRFKVFKYPHSRSLGNNNLSGLEEHSLQNRENFRPSIETFICVLYQRDNIQAPFSTSA